MSLPKKTALPFSLQKIPIWPPHARATHTSSNYPLFRQTASRAHTRLLTSHFLRVASAPLASPAINYPLNNMNDIMK